MNTELRKRLIEAAEKYIKTITPDDIPYYHKDVKQGFIAGAEYGYKEAITQAKEWIGDICYKVGFSNATISKCVESFETEMNKLWEEKK